MLVMIALDADEPASDDLNFKSFLLFYFLIRA